ncbi:hypothetical protein TrRE_jg13636 [Triparma retinervis]|uniref:Palmitoyltransferase n=1 Tax=Triparma retinervis TaxID=2557542 RepID=A0A9W6Z715_9STRA|nr:hypothetical protein TrRE_jg13636 [Triparma retinervis]
MISERTSDISSASPPPAPQPRRPSNSLKPRPPSLSRPPKAPIPSRHSREQPTSVGSSSSYSRRSTHSSGTAGLITYDPSLPRYLQWKGRQKFYNGGRVMFGPNVRQFLLTLMLTAASWGAFLSMVPEKIPKTGWAEGGWEVYVGSVVLFSSMVVFLLLTATSDPGIIPRKSASSLVSSMPLELKERMNYCPTCHIVKPPRTKHCRQSDCCIRRFDHHCPWTGNSVGEGNYRLFMGFITSVFLGTTFCLGLTAAAFMEDLGLGWWGGADGTSDDVDGSGADGGSEGRDWVLEIGAPLLMIWYCLVEVLVGALLAFHLYLISVGLTTNEWLRGEKDGGGRDRSSCPANCWAVWTARGARGTMLLPMHMPPGMEDEERDLEAAEEAVDKLQIELRPLG